AGVGALQREHALAALDGVEEVDLDVHAQVGGAHRTAGLPTAQISAEERLEEIDDPEVAEAPGGRAEHVVALPALGIGQHLVRLAARVKALRSSRSAVAVG